MDYKREIRNFIIENFLFGEDDGTLQEETSFLENGIIDSTGILEVISFIEESYGISIDDSEMLPENLDSLNNIQRFLSGKISLQTQEK